MRPGQPAHGGRRTPGPAHRGRRIRRRRPGQDPGRVLAALPHPLRLVLQHDPQEHVDGRRFEWPRGRMLGGSSSMNAMLYVRGNALDYDTWRDVHGCTGWGYADLLPYFIAGEDNARGASAHHGVGGPLRVEDQRSPSAFAKAFVEAAAAVGLPRNVDSNGAEQDGVGLFQVTQRRGRRWSAADAYLRPALDRPGLEVVTHALVTRVVIENGRAVGVEYVADGRATVVSAGEVVLSGGAVNSPQILLLSGVGPAADLTRAWHPGRSRTSPVSAATCRTTWPPGRSGGPATTCTTTRTCVGSWSGRSSAVVRSRHRSPRGARSSGRGPVCRRRTSSCTWRPCRSSTTRAASRRTPASRSERPWSTSRAEGGCGLPAPIPRGRRSSTRTICPSARTSTP